MVKRILFWLGIVCAVAGVALIGVAIYVARTWDRVYDLVAIISFLRAQPPVRNAVPSNEWTTMGKVVKSLVGTGRVPRAVRGELRRLSHAARSDHVCGDRT